MGFRATRRRYRLGDRIHMAAKQSAPKRWLHGPSEENCDDGGEPSRRERRRTGRGRRVSAHALEGAPATTTVAHLQYRYVSRPVYSPASRPQERAQRVAGQDHADYRSRSLGADAGPAQSRLRPAPGLGDRTIGNALEIAMRSSSGFTSRIGPAKSGGAAIAMTITTSAGRED